MPFRIGLTGGIASGKTTVANLFADLGASVIDTDIIAREVVRPGEPALDEIARRFGQSALDESGHLDRAAMRKLIFASDTDRNDLEAIVHPRIGQEVLRQSRQVAGPYQIIVVPLLVHSPLRDFVDRVLVVDCDEDQQLRRLMARDSESNTQAQKILDAQSNRKQRLDMADDVVQNNRGLDHLEQRVTELHHQYLHLAESQRAP